MKQQLGFSCLPVDLMFVEEDCSVPAHSSYLRQPLQILLGLRWDPKKIIR